ncbi:isoleucine--tRNA ligase [Lysinibacillus sp. 2017]|uniref:isoleucine--tRNA ligase n=1 Tax=unclassified Lysinibacillus TaxID=2636778 RepID=UPI000D528E7B|nr:MULTISPECIES: isoleucine--tRNA ligase [unclassified Lysinibacillus]AWE07832.1 isoleucine--tRNA ligase [Lysinibacillus sp. 2017]TGN32275.1 isoleucine--tRNA ligase [Lysinibacillus sp. S2017]
MQDDVKRETTVERESRIQKFWSNENIFAHSVDNRKDHPTFVFYEGPPTANGLPHVGHALGRTIKDVVARYKTMQGFQVERKAGWDTHGLPVELGVEKELGISGKQEVEKYGVQPFIEKCKESVFKYELKWRAFTDQLGYWVNMDNPYLTLSNDYIESVWNILSHVHKDGRLYKGHRVSPYCPSCQTSLSSHEVAQGYKDVKDLSATVKFKVQGKEEYFLGWTTTPWTLPANVALAMNETISYARVLKDGEVYIVAKSLIEKLFQGEVEIISEHTGADFEGVRYEAPFQYVQVERGHEVVLADYVTELSGTGIVHIAPAYGEDDYRTVQQNELSFINVVDSKGCYTAEVSELKGRFVKDCDVEIIKLLAEKQLLFSKEKYEHSYPHCWRCDSPLLYYATDSWFINMSALRDELIENNNQVNWYPDHIKQGRFGKFLENVVDWNISRNRYWGTPLNIWICEDCGHEEAPKSIEALKDLVKQPFNTDLELHKPYIDEITCECPICQSEMKRTPEVIDVWFDSGSMPFAQYHYPFENDEKFKQQFPADVVIEGIDQTRGFFYSLLAVSTLFTGKAPYKNVLSLGHVLDENGQKMSKSKGNALDPVELMEQYGADALRWSLLVDSSPWNPKRFAKRNVQEAKSKLIDTLDNTFKFYQLYAEIDQFTYNSAHVGERSTLDQWILSRLHKTIQKVTNFMEEYQFTQASREIAQLVEELSNWYIRRSRNRFWANGMSADKIAAFSTLHEVLSNISLLLAPFTPYIAEDIYQQLHGESVHLQDYPSVNESLINNQLEFEMQHVLSVVELGRSIRNEKAIKVKQPLANLYISTKSSHQNYLVYKEIIEQELNVKSVQWVSNFKEYETIQYTLNFKKAGAAFGKTVNKMKEIVLHLTSEEKQQLEQQQSLEVLIDGQNVTLTMEHLIKHSIVDERFALNEDGECRVLLDLVITDDLKKEGQMRELIRAIQDARKQWNLPVNEYIAISIVSDEGTIKWLKDYETFLNQNVLLQGVQYQVEYDTNKKISLRLFDEQVSIYLIEQ